MSDTPNPTPGHPMPARGPYPLNEWDRRHLAAIVHRLTTWRAEDHEDAITLGRGEVIMLLEGLKRGHLK
jgi:hypothetical protein